MFPLTAKVKCPHYGRQSEFEAEAVEKVASFEDVVGGADITERGQLVGFKSVIVIPSG
jgi:hypothetical protein